MRDFFYGTNCKASLIPHGNVIMLRIVNSVLPIFALQTNSLKMRFIFDNVSRPCR